MNYSENLQAATDVLRKAKRVLVLTGAGISAESGIPTFRGGGGSSVWRGMPFDQLSSARLVEDDLPLLWDWFDYRRGIVGGCKPNPAHEALARASNIKRFKSFTVVTQNIDGLHQAAGTREVIELHGSIWRARCLSCGRAESLKVIPQDERPPVCKDCLDSMRPDVVLFGEALPMTNLFVAQDHAEKCDVCIVVGTSAQVYPAAALPHKAKANGATVIEVNTEETELSAYADISLQGKASEVLFDLFTFLEEPFEELEEIEEPLEEFRLDEIRIDSEAEIESPEEEETPSLSFLMSEELESNRELILEVGYGAARARMYLFRPEDGQSFMFVGGTGSASEDEGDEIADWEPELVASIADGIKTIADGDKIFYADGLFVNPDFREEIAECLGRTAEELSDEELRKLELFQRPTSAEEWLSRAGTAEPRVECSSDESRLTEEIHIPEPPIEPVNPFSEPVSTEESIEAEDDELVSDRHFMLFWRETSVTTAERLGTVLDVVSSNQLDGILRGDTLWVATVENGELVLVGRMRVGEIIGREEAERRFGDENVWKSNLFAVALDTDSCELPRRVHLGERAYDLRFMEDDADRFVSVEGRISRSQTRKVRELTFGSAEMLAGIWEEDKSGVVSDEDLEPTVISFDPCVDDDPAPVVIDEAKLDLFKGCLLGGAVGDALGAPIEFHSIGAIRSSHGDQGLTDFVPAYGKIGAVTDDTQMTLFTAEGLLRAQTRRSHRGICYPARIIYHAYLRWLQTQGATIEDESVQSFVYETRSWLRDVPEMNALRAPGNTCLEALASGTMGTIDEPLNDRKGCGGVMRVAPIGLIALDPFGLASEAAAITHGHPSGYLSAGVLALVIGKVLNGSTLMAAVEHAVYEVLPQHKGHEETLEACDRAIRLAKLHLGLAVEEDSSDVPSSDSENAIRDPQSEIRNGFPSPEAVESLGAGWIAEEALAISLYCALVHETDFEKAVLLAVNHSGDSDSTGAITGNILGVIHGEGGIPSRWLERLELRETIAEIAQDLLIGFRSGTEWSDRYPGI